MVANDCCSDPMCSNNAAQITSSISLSGRVLANYKKTTTSRRKINYKITAESIGQKKGIPRSESPYRPFINVTKRHCGNMPDLMTNLTG